MNVAPRVSLPYVDLSGIAQLWSDKCEAFICYEHISDATVKKTHCHFLMMGVTVSIETLKNIAKAEITTGKGQQFWKWESKNPPDETFIMYMSKGKFAPKFVKNLSPELIEEQRSKWVDLTAKVESSIVSTAQASTTIYTVYKKPPSTTVTRKFLLEEMSQRLYDSEIPKGGVRVSVTDSELIELIIKVIRKYGIGINIFHVREYYYALRFDNETTRNQTVSKCLSIL